MSDYDKPPELYEGLRLHQNENTGGCSPRVIEALRALGPEQVAVYPPYSAAVQACARHFNVDAGWIALTNGLDEGIMAAAVVYLRGAGVSLPEAVVPEPAFEIFEFNASVVGARVIRVMPRPDLSFPLEEIVEAITPATRIVFLTNPNNPTGLSTTDDAVAAIAGRLPAGAIVFLDEAYADFAPASFLPNLRRTPNVVVGRTFAKAYGLAGIRLGALIGAPAALDPIRRAIGVYSVNVAAVVALQAALQDVDHVRAYLRQVTESKTLLYAACDRLGLTYWRSDANFVLIRVGPDAPRVVAEAASRGVYFRDRSNEPGCAGCIRITTGVVAHTRRGLDVLEEVLCAAR